MKPMLAIAAPETLVFPLYASFKLDGVRCVVKDGAPWTRRLEPLPNQYVQYLLGSALLNGLDGELVVGLPYAPNVFSVSQSGTMSIAGEPDFTYYVFDYWNGPTGQPYHERYAALQRYLPALNHPRIVLLEQRLIYNMDELNDMMERALEEGYEGLILRSLDSPYKFGRSTAKQGWMMKLKKWAHGEAVVIGAQELQRNDNELEVNNVGGAKRSKAQEGLVPAGLLGSLEVRDCATGVEFSIGSGFSLAERAQLWADHTGQPVQYTTMDNGLQTHTVNPSGVPVLGRISRYKHFEVGVKDKPRFPIHTGFRDARDMGEPS
jgi:DNA ligase-1